MERVTNTLLKGLGALFQIYGRRNTRWPRWRSCRRSWLRCSWWPFEARRQRPIAAWIGQDSARGPFSASNSHEDVTKAVTWRATRTESFRYDSDRHQPRPQTRTDHSRRCRGRAQTPTRHTRTCNTVVDVYMCTSQVALMDMERAPWRGSTAGFCAISIAMSGGRMVRVPVAGRCGRRGGATATLPGRRWGERSRPSSSTNSEPSSARMTAPYSALRSSDDLSGDLDARERRLTDRERVLRAGEQRLRTEERLFRAERAPLASTSKIGRKERCPCGSGLKYKHCHGHTGAASCQRAHHQRVERKSSRDSSTRSPR